MDMFAIAVLVGFGVGVLSGLFGIGGGTIMVPVFRLGFAMSAIQATATSLFVIVPTSISGFVGHIRGKTCVLPLGIAAGLGGACTSPLGVYLATLSPAWALMLGAGAVIAYSSTTMFRRALALPKKSSAVSAAPSASASPTVPAAPADTSNPGEFVLERKHIAMAAIIGMAAGVMSGYVGVGGGFLMVPLFLSVIGLPMKKASGTSLVAMPILVLPGVIEQFMLGNVEVLVGIAMAAGAIPGALLGARLMRRMPERALRFGFSITLLCVAAFLVVNEFVLSAA